MDKLRFHYWLAAAALAIPGSLLIRDPYASSILNLISIAALMAASLRFVMLIGELNFAIAAFAGIGAYTAGAAATTFQLPFLMALCLGAAMAMLISIIFGAITLRTRGPYFLLIGFAFTEAVRILYTKSATLGGTSGMIGIFPPVYLDAWMPTLVMSMVILLLFALYALEKSSFGTVLIAIRDNEDVVRSVGVNVLFTKVSCFAIASFCAGMAGGLHAFVNNVISPGDFSFLLAAFALAYVKVGGESDFIGPIVGAALLVLLNAYSLGLGAAEHVFYGAAILLSVLLMPQGVTGLSKSVIRFWKRQRSEAAQRPQSQPVLQDRQERT